MKRTVNLLASVWLAVAVEAEDTVSLHNADTVVSAEVPAYWELLPAKDAVLAASPGGVGVMSLRVIDSDIPLHTITGELIQQLAQNDVIVDSATVVKGQVHDGTRRWTRTMWNGHSREWGPTVIGLLVTPLNAHGRTVVLAYWLSERDSERSLKSLQGMFATVRTSQPPRIATAISAD